MKEDKLSGQRVRTQRYAGLPERERARSGAAVEG